MSVEAREKMRAAALGREVSAATRAKISAARLGKKKSPETRARMRLGHLGKPHPPVSLETRAKLRAAQRGRPATDQTRAKIGAAFRGKKLSPEHRAKLRAASQGEKNAQWRGGSSNEGYDLAFTDEFKENIRIRDHRRCRLCSVPESDCGTLLSVHHIDYDKGNSDPVNLVSLCNSCHIRTNTNRRHWMTVFRSFMVGDMLAGIGLPAVADHGLLFPGFV